MTEDHEELHELIRACTEPTSDRLRVLLEQGGDPNFRNADDESLLTYSIVWHRLGSVRVLLDARVDVEQADSAWSPLMYAADEGLSEAAKWLVDAGANTARRDEHGRTAADLAEARAHSDLATWLKSHARGQR